MFFVVFCLHGWSPLAQEIPTDEDLSRPTHLPYFCLVEPLVSAFVGATPQLYGIVRELLDSNSRVCAGYEGDIYLLCSPYQRCFCRSLERFDLFGGCLTQRRQTDVLLPSPSAISVFHTPHCICSTLVLFFVSTISIFRTCSYRPHFAFCKSLQPPNMCCGHIREVGLLPGYLSFEISIFRLCCF